MKFKVEMTARGTIRNTVSFEADSISEGRQLAARKSDTFRNGVKANLQGYSESLDYERRLFQVTETVKEI